MLKKTHQFDIIMEECLLYDLLKELLLRVTIKII